ncbi:hypothetical protein T492DRAFT_964398 [Pavlovales sp. CCMP2436]|nr:hypothetical protein T492DRAFT_964398 [Pavlovales sp. CCMP2436]
MAAQHTQLAGRDYPMEDSQPMPQSVAAAAATAAVTTASPAAAAASDLREPLRPPLREDSEPIPQVAVLPSGEMVYLSKENPYNRAFAENNAEPGTYGPGDDPYAAGSIPPALLAQYQQPLILERMGRIVRLLAMFDLIFSLMNVLARMWPAAITAVMAYCGYVGARMFRRDLTRVYLFYLIFIAIVRISVTVHWSIEPNVSFSAQIFLVVSSLLQLVIAHFVWRFYSLLPTSEEESRFIQMVAEHQSGRGLV